MSRRAAATAKKATPKKATPKKATPAKAAAATKAPPTKAAAATKAPATKAPPRSATDETIAFADAAAWTRWLARHHATSPGIWMKLAKKSAGVPSVTYPEAVDGALTWGWIDGQKRPLDASAWLQRFTPRGARSLWSRINRDKAIAMIASGAMQPPGLAEVERARKDGRWDAAYASPKQSVVPDDLAAALAARPRAASFFTTLNAANRYAVLWRIETAKKAETRARRIADLVAMLDRGEKLH